MSRGQKFGTYDHNVQTDMDALVCGAWFKSGWWFNSKCNADASGNLNVPLEPDPENGQLKGVIWKGVPYEARINATKMMIRPRNFLRTSTFSVSFSLESL